MKTLIWLRSGLFVIPLILGTLSPVNAQITLEWEQLFGVNGGAIWDCIELENGHYLLTYGNSTYNRIISEVGPGGAFLESNLVPNPASAQYLVQVDTGEITTRVGEVNDSSSFCLLSYDNGLEWVSDRVLGGTFDVNHYSHGGYISGGYLDHFPIPISSFVRKYDENGHLQWINDYSSPDFINAITVVGSNVSGYIFAPVGVYSIPERHLSIKKINSDGIEIGVFNYQCYDTPISAHSILFNSDGNLFMAGYFAFNPYVDYYYAIEITPDGDLLRTMEAPDVDNAINHKIWAMPDGGYLATCTQYREYPQRSAIILTRYDATYTQLWQDDYSVSGFDYDEILDYDVIIHSDGHISLFGDLTNYEGSDCDFLARLQPDPTDFEIAVDAYADVSAVPAPGRFFWHGTLTNNTDADITTDIWVIVRGPDGYPSEPLRVWENITVPANGVYEADLRQNIPADAASGEYNYILRAGTYEPGNPQHVVQDYFTLTVTGGTEVNLDPTRTRGVVAAPFDGPVIAAQTE